MEHTLQSRLKSTYIDPTCVPNEPEGTVCFTKEYQKRVLQVLNGINVVLLIFVLLVALYNSIFFMCKAKIRHTFIVLFYLLAFFCLFSWLITAIKQTISPDARYLVFQSIDEPEYYNDTANISQAAFLGLFGLISATMYQIDQSLKLLLPYNLKSSEQRARRNIKIFNYSILALVMIYSGVFLWIFFTPIDVGRKWVLIINLVFRLLFLMIYLVTVCRLNAKFRFFTKGVLVSEIRSIRLQFWAFFTGFITQAAFVIVEIVYDNPTISFEAVKTIVFLVSFLVPILVILYAHYNTFKGIQVDQDSQVAQNSEESANKQVNSATTGSKASLHGRNDSD